MPEVITDNLDLWTSALLTKSTAGRGSNGKLEAYGIKKLRELILELAVRGKLVPQDASDEPASELFKRIAAEKARLIAEGKIKKDKLLPPISEEEKPYALPLCWEWIRLPEVYFSISPSGSKLLSSAIKDAGTFPVVDQGQRYIAGYTDDAALLINLPGPVIVFGDHTTERKYIDFDFVAGADGVKILRPILQDEHFFFRQLQGYRLEERGYARHFKVLNDNLYALPPIEEQHRIVAKVDELMALCGELEQQQTHSIAAHQALVETLLGTLTRVQSQQEFSAAWARIASHFDTLFTTEASIDQLKQTILQLAVMGKLVAQDRSDGPASELLKRVQAEKVRLISEGKIKKDKPLEPITDNEKPYGLPLGWAWSRVGQLFNVTSGGSFDIASEKESGKFIYVKVGDMNIPENETVISTSSRFVNPTAKELRGIIPANSIIFPKRGGAIATNKKRLVTSDIFVDLNIMAITIPKQISLQYAFQWLSGIDLAQLNTGTSVPQINHQDIEPLIFPLPPIEEQHRIVTKVDELMALCDALKARLADAQAIQLHLADAIVEQAVC